jgi:hypothetical protein
MVSSTISPSASYFILMILVLKTKNILKDSPVSFTRKKFLSIFIYFYFFVENHGIFKNNPNSVEVAKILLQYVFHI